MRRLERQDLSALERGARFLGSGGAGDPGLARLLVHHLWPDGATVDIVPGDELPRDVTVIATGLIGSVTAFAERPAAGDEFTRAFDRLRRHLDPTGPVYVATYEAAGLNALIPALIALQTGLPIADVDCMGRGLSWMDQTTYASAGVPICPFTLSTPNGHSFIVEQTPSAEAERYIRALAFEMGGWAAFAGYPTDTPTSLQHGIPGSLERCLEIGRTASLDELLEHPSLGARLIGSGRVTEVRWAFPGGYPRLTAIVQQSSTAVPPLRIEASNEFLLVVEAGTIVAEVPEIICLVELASGTPIVAERVVRGMEVGVVTLPAPDRWLAPDIAASVSAARFGVTTGGGTRAA